MVSQWYKQKEEALRMRQLGKSIKTIEKKLGIPRSTLSYWFRSIKLTPLQQKTLILQQEIGLAKARAAAALWHQNQKEIRLSIAEHEAKSVLEKINLNDMAMLELALAMLYWGEGFKKSAGTGMGNADPEVLQFFLYSLRKLYKLDESKIKCELHLRADQNAEKLRKFWSEALELPQSAFSSVSYDKRTAGIPSYPDYKGVCVVRVGTVAIARKLMYLSKAFGKTMRA
jgi:hypothetical protein